MRIPLFLFFLLAILLPLNEASSNKKVPVIPQVPALPTIAYTIINLLTSWTNLNNNVNGQFKAVEVSLGMKNIYAVDTTNAIWSYTYGIKDSWNNTQMTGLKI